MKEHNSVSTINNRPHLNSFAFEEEGMLFWWGSWYANILGYASLKTLENSIAKSRENCIQIGLSIEDNFIQVQRSLNGKKIKDYKLTKFACFLIAIHADDRKDAVKKAQVYFINEFKELNLHMQNQEFVRRKLARQEIKQLNSALSKSAARSRVRDYSYFINEGFIGMYNSTVRELKKSRGIASNANIYDNLGTTELAAHIFRIALTTERLAHLRNSGEARAAREHLKIGARIRALIKENIGIYPEFMKTKFSINQLEQRLRKASERLNAIEHKSLNA